MLIRAWLAVGTQSVGGGPSTILLIRRLMVERHAWLTAREFTEYWSLAQVSPGIHLVALAGLIGRHIAGWRGVVIAVGGMMIPAAVVTVAMTALFAAVAGHPVADAALAGVAPAAGGLTLALGLMMARDVRQRGSAVVLDAAVVAAAFAAITVARLSPVAVIAVSAAFGAVFLRRERPTSERGAG